MAALDLQFSVLHVDAGSENLEVFGAAVELDRDGWSPDLRVELLPIHGWVGGTNRLRPGAGGRKVRFYKGIALRKHADPVIVGTNCLKGDFWGVWVSDGP